LILEKYYKITLS